MNNPKPDSWAYGPIEDWLTEKGISNTFCGRVAATVNTCHDLYCVDCQVDSRLLLEADIEAFGEIQQASVNEIR